MGSDFDHFFRTNYDAMVRSLTLMCGDAELAAECAQDAFTRAYARWRRISRYDVPAAWVRRVAINRVRDQVRSEQRRRAREDKAARRDETRWHDDHPAVADDRLARALSSLPDRQRTAIALHYVEGLSVHEVALVMKVSEGAVKYHLHEGRKKLEPLLDPRATEGVEP
ncbi:MAG: sigma-70 family RNA polymerase sigma factor [Acidimicrobiales bacterium]|nr:sigma-70 family RNA polymerase sigma factor [Acidimicrobiales bacterium]